MSYKTYYDLIVRPCLLTKYNYINNNTILNFKKCTLTISFSNDNIEEDTKVLHSLFLLELLGCQKSHLKNVSCVYRAKTKSLVFVIKVCLHDLFVFNYIQLFLCVILPNFKLRYIKRNLLVNKRSFAYSFAFKDMNIIPTLPEIYYKWEYLLNTTIVLKNYNKVTMFNEINDFYKFFYLTTDFVVKKKQIKDEQITVSEDKILKDNITV